MHVEIVKNRCYTIYIWNFIDPPPISKPRYHNTSLNTEDIFIVYHGSKFNIYSLKRMMYFLWNLKYQYTPSCVSSDRDSSTSWLSYDELKSSMYCRFHNFEGWHITLWTLNGLQSMLFMQKCPCKYYKTDTRRHHGDLCLFSFITWNKMHVQPHQSVKCMNLFGEKNIYI